MTEDLALGQAVVVATPEGLGITNIFTQIVNSEDLSNHIESYRTSSTTTDIIPEHEPCSVGQTMDTHQGPSLFGEPLERVLSRENSPVPALVQMCVKIIDDNGLDVEVYPVLQLQIPRINEVGSVSFICTNGVHE